MPFSGGTFSLIFSWLADRNAGIDISASRMDTQEADIAVGLTDCITRDGQSLPTANLPMGNYRHTSVGNGVARTDYSSLGQTQDGLVNWAIAGGTADALTAVYTPPLTLAADGQLCFVRASFANATATPTFSPGVGFIPYVITKSGGVALGAGDINGSLQELILRYNASSLRWELLNPSTAPIVAALTAGVPSTGDVKLTLKTVADANWLMFADQTIGNAGSGATYANVAALALYTLLWNNVSNTYAPVSTGRGVSAAADWAGLKTIQLLSTLGRALGVAGAGSGLTSRALGQTLGSETNTIGQTNLPSVNFTVSGGGGTLTSTSTAATFVKNTGIIDSATAGGGTQALFHDVAAVSMGAVTSNATMPSQTAASGGSGTALNNMEPGVYLNAMVKL